MADKNWMVAPKCYTVNNNDDYNSDDNALRASDHNIR